MSSNAPARVAVRAARGESSGRLRFGDLETPCALGRSGIVPRDGKREGDGATPAGQHPILAGYYRADRLCPPPTPLRLRPLAEDSGWCDDPADPAYNRYVTRPFRASHEVLWREDERYDLLLVLGYNTDPPQAGRGSAIFLHVCPPELPPTAGCVAIPRGELCALLTRVWKPAILDIALM